MPSQSDELEHLAARGVYEQPFLVKGCREFVAVDSTGSMIAARLVKRGSASTRAERELWEELDLHDPIAPHLTPPELRLLK